MKELTTLSSPGMMVMQRRNSTCEPFAAVKTLNVMSISHSCITGYATDGIILVFDYVSDFDCEYTLINPK